MIYSVLVLAPFENYLILQPDLVGETERLTAEKSFKQVSEAYAQLSGSKSLTDTDQEGRVNQAFMESKKHALHLIIPVNKVSMVQKKRIYLRIL